MDPSLEEVFDLIDAALEVLRTLSPDRMDADEQVEYLRCTAQCLSQMDRFAEAEQALQQGLCAHPDEPRLLCELGIVLSESGREEDAQRHFERVLSILPEDASIRYHYGYVLEKLNCLEEAIAQYRRVIEIDPEYDWAHLRLAECLADLGEDEPAVAAYEEYLRRCPSDAGAWIGLGILHSDGGQYAEALQCYERARERQGDTEDLHYNWFITCLRQGDLAAAEQKLADLKECNPTGSRALFAEAYLAQRRNDLEMTRLKAWQAVGRSMEEGEEQCEDALSGAMGIFCEQRWARDADRLYARALSKGALPEGLLAAYNEVKHERLARGVWCALAVSAAPQSDPKGSPRYLRSYEVEAPDLITGEAMALQMEQCLGGADCRIECVEETQDIESFHPGVVWVDRATRPAGA
jgi:tetratricopeptide (TPR) repeat protein